MMAATIRPPISSQSDRLHPEATTGTNIFHRRTMVHFKNSADLTAYYLGLEVQSCAMAENTGAVLLALVVIILACIAIFAAIHVW